MSEEQKKPVNIPQNFKDFETMKKDSDSVGGVVDATINELLAPDEPIPVILESLGGKQVHLRIPKYEDFQLVYKSSGEDQMKANILLVNRCLVKPNVDYGIIAKFKVPVIIEIVKWLNQHGGVTEEQAERAKNSQEGMDQASGD